MATAQMESTCDAVITKLVAGLNTKITTLNGLFGDAYTLDAVDSANIILGVRAEFAYPTVMVLPEDSDPEVDVGSRIIWRHRVRVVTWVADWDAEALPRRLLRYERAVREVILADRSIADGGFGIRHLRDERGPVFRPEPEGHFTQAATSLFEVRQQQDG